MEEPLDHGMELFCQDGVLLKSASASYIQYVNTSGTLSIVEYPNSNQTRYIEWKPNDITVDSDVQDQEWAVVNTVERRYRTLSGSSPPEGALNRIKIRINMKEVKSFKVTRFNQKLSFNDQNRKPICTFVFQHGNADSLVAALRGGLMPVRPSRERNLYLVVENSEFNRINKSFAELNLFQTPEQSSDYVWKFFKNLHNRPYETTMEAFAKLTDIIYRGPDMPNRLNDDLVEDLLTRSLTQIDNLDRARSSENVSQAQDEYEVVSATPHGTPSVLQSNLPPKPIIHRSQPLNETQWKGLMDSEGRISDVDGVKMLIFRGGVENSLRKEVWKFLLGFFPWDSSFEERQKIDKDLRDQYEKIKVQWTLITPKQEQNHSEYRERKSLVEKDVNRTDRTDPFYAGENNPNLQQLFDILMTYVMYNFDLGYVQGMSDLCSPILCLLEDEVEAFWCFVGFMDKVCLNFEEDQTEIKEQLASIHEILMYIEPELASYLRQNDSGNMFFCFRWLLVWFKREFCSADVRILWEVLWTGLPCQNFHIVICAAILQREKSNLEAQRSFAGILKYVNELSGKIDVQEALILGEALYHQIAAAGNLAPENVRVLLGLPIGNCSQNSCSQNDSTSSLDYDDPLLETHHSNSIENVSESAFDRALDMSYI